MTRKDYVKFAAMLKDMNPGYTLEAHQLSFLSARMADIFAADNPNFDRARFLAACGVES